MVVEKYNYQYSYFRIQGAGRWKMPFADVLTHRLPARRPDTGADAAAAATEAEYVVKNTENRILLSVSETVI